jgi:hypothetical protein
MGVLWSPIINIAILLAFYSYRRYAIIIHGLLGTAISLYSIITSLAILGETGLIDTNFPNISLSEYDPDAIVRHYLIGLVCVAFIALVMISGFGARMVNILQGSPGSIILIKDTHRISGLIVALICKLNTYLLTDAYAYIAIDVVCVILWFIRKKVFPKMENKPEITYNV